MFRKPEAEATTLFDSHHPAADTAAVVTVPAAANEVWVLDRIDWSYEKPSSTKEELKVEINSVKVWAIDIALVANANGLVRGNVDFRQGGKGGLYGAKNQELKVTLSAGAGTVIGKVNILYR
jgi:hypothetical protein